MPSEPIALNLLPYGMACLECRYDLTGLPWGTPCPECGFPVPTTWPTEALIEAHPKFIAHTHRCLRGLVVSDILILVGLALTLAANASNFFQFVLSNLIPFRALYLLGVLSTTVGVVWFNTNSAMLALRHRHARMGLDQPERRAIAKTMAFVLLPIPLALFIAILSNGAFAWITLPMSLVTVIGAVVLLVVQFRHAATTIKRCGQYPQWTHAQFLSGLFTTLALINALAALAWPMPAFGMALMALLFTLLLTHALRMAHAARCVRTILKLRSPPAPREPTSATALERPDVL